MSTSLLTVSAAFNQALSTAHTYPVGLLEKSIYSALLEVYRQRLDKAVLRLFLPDEGGTEVAFRDLKQIIQNPAEPPFDRQKVRSLQSLRDCLGINQIPASARVPNSMTSWEFRKKAPRCRFVFLYGKHSRAALKITKAMATEMMMYLQVMPSYLDFLLLFGQKSGPNDMKFSAFRGQNCLKRPSGFSSGMEDIGRSGLHYEMAYNLKTVQLEVHSDPGSWRVRPAAVYHSLDVIYGTTSWIITRALMKDASGTETNDLKSRVEHITGLGGRQEDRTFETPSECFRSSLAIHEMIVHWASEWWRYLQWLDERIEDETEQAVDGTRDKFHKARREYTQEDIQNIQKLVDAANEVAIIVDGNVEVMTALCDNYQGLVTDINWPLDQTTQDAAQMFQKQTRNTISDLKNQSSRAKALANHARERQQLILQYIQAQTAEHMEHLSKSTYSVGVSSQNEAINMRIITFITLIYLPATFVSTFFSTDVIKYQSGNTQASNSGSSLGSFSSVALYRWLQVSLPLTMLTFVVAWVVYKWERQRQERKRVEVLASLDLFTPV